MKRILYSAPVDMQILLGIEIIGIVLMAVLKMDEMVAAILILVYAIGLLVYYEVNKRLSNKGERNCKYLYFWNVWGNKNNVFISMRKAKKTTQSSSNQGKMALKVFVKEMRNLSKILPSGTRCCTCTHDVIVKQILKIDPNLKKKKAYLKTLKEVRAILGLPDDKIKRQFYRVKFKMP